MKKALLTSIAALFLATGAAHAYDKYSAPVQKRYDEKGEARPRSMLISTATGFLNISLAAISRRNTPLKT